MDSVDLSGGKSHSQSCGRWDGAVWDIRCEIVVDVVGGGVNG